MVVVVVGRGGRKGVPPSVEATNKLRRHVDWRFTLRRCESKEHVQARVVDITRVYAAEVSPSHVLPN